MSPQIGPAFSFQDHVLLTYGTEPLRKILNVL